MADVVSLFVDAVTMQGVFQIPKGCIWEELMINMESTAQGRDMQSLLDVWKKS